MSLEKRLYQKAERPSQFPSLLSPCHNRQIIGGPVLLMGRDGTTSRIGHMRYCYFDGWTENRVRVECRKPISVLKFRDWPDSLTGTEALRICDHRGPEYWWESGFHLFQWDGKWTTLQAHDCMPPWARRDFDKLDKRAQKIVRSLSRAKASGKFSSAFDPEVPLVPAKSIPRIYSNPGIAKMNAAKGIAEQMKIAKDLDRQQLAAGEGAYEPGLEDGQYSKDAPGAVVNPAGPSQEAGFIDRQGRYHAPSEPATVPVRIPSKPAPKKPDLTEFFDAE